MKYFTKKWCFGQLSTNTTNKIINDYNVYIETIYKELPVPLKFLIKNMSLHDGIINRVVFFKNNKILEIYGIFNLVIIN